MRNVEEKYDFINYLEAPGDRIGMLHSQKKAVGEKTSMTDYLLHNVYSDGRMRELRGAEYANASMSLMAYRINDMGNAAMCYAPVAMGAGQYEMPEIDMEEVSSIGVAMAMLILSVMQNEIMLDTQMEAVKGTQSQKLSASQTKLLEIKQQIRKSRYMSPFQKFMRDLSNSCVMKFLNSQYGKAIMFAIGAIVTIASFGSAGPAMIAISSVLLSFQAAELIMGKSMGELITSGMDDGAAKMALQMSIDIGLMVASIATGGGDAASNMGDAAEAADVVGDAAEMAAKVADQVGDAAEAADKLSDMANMTDDMAEAVQNVQKAAADMAEAATGFTDKAGDLAGAMEDGLSQLEDLEKLTEAQEAFKKFQEAQEQMKNAMDSLDDVVGKAGDLGGDAAQAMIENTQKLGRQALDTGERAQELGQKALEKTKGILDKVLDKVDDVAKAATDKVDDVAKTANKGLKGTLVSAARFAVGIRGLEHLSFAKQLVVALQKFQQRVQAMMQMYQALYKLALSEEEARKMVCAGEIEAINAEQGARIDFLQMVIDNQLADIQSLMGKQKAAIEQAMTAIREHGEAMRDIVRNI